MTTEKLDEFYTEPNQLLAKIRFRLIELGEARIRRLNIQAQTQNAPAISQREAFLEATNAVSQTLFELRDLIDHQGRVLKADLGL